MLDSRVKVLRLCLVCCEAAKQRFLFAQYTIWLVHDSTGQGFILLGSFFTRRLFPKLSLKRSKRRPHLDTSYDIVPRLFKLP